MIEKLTSSIGTVLLLLGVLGFVPGLSTAGPGNQQLLFGTFMVGPFHNAFHIVSGIAGMLASTTDRFARWYLRIFGSVYTALALLGFTVGIAQVNLADHLLHASLAIVMLGAGVVMKYDPVSISKFSQHEVTQ